MPVIKIEIIKGKSLEYKKAILDGVHNALVVAFKISDDDRMQMVFEFDKVDFEFPNIRSENFTLIEISAFHGRSVEAKRLLYTEIIKNLGSNPAIAGKDIMILLNEQPKENWSISEGKAAIDIQIGIKIEV